LAHGFRDFSPRSWLFCCWTYVVGRRLWQQEHVEEVNRKQKERQRQKVTGDKISPGPIPRPIPRDLVPPVWPHLQNPSSFSSWGPSAQCMSPWAHFIFKPNNT
jgi:hypothetical protein